MQRARRISYSRIVYMDRDKVSQLSKGPEMQAWLLGESYHWDTAHVRPEEDGCTVIMAVDGGSRALAAWSGLA